MSVANTTGHQQLVAEWNATDRPFPSDRCVHELFEEWVIRSPEALAVVAGETRLTYGALDHRANELVGQLLDAGVTRGSRVAIVLERSIELIVAQLAVLKCGAVYVPIDGDAPPVRVEAMRNDSGCSVVITGSGVEAAEDVHPEAGADGALALAGDAPAYIMYTSGSTGEPKGVVVPHRAIARLVLNNGFAGFGSDDRVAFAANPAFDASTLEVWAPLLNGGSVVVFDRETVLTPKRFNEELLAQGVTVLWLTAGLFAQYADALGEAFSRLRYLIAGGDVLDRDAVARVLKNSRPEHLLNGYGPTETTTFAATYEVTEVAEEAGIPIGRPIGNTRIYIVDAQGVPVPPGATGELYVGGMGVALGYWNRPELTAERFVASPFVEGDRLYKTGDLGRYRSDGAIEFLGRNDGQVKIRGFRIEVGEIEARLRRIEGVGEAVVVAREDAPGEKRLVAYYTLGRSDADLQAEALRASLLLDLPEYMVPAAYVELDALPLTPNGKVDRSALPMPGAEAFVTRGYEAPVGEREAAIARIWSETLQLDRIGRNDDFFELGGHSLLIVRVIERMRSEGLHVDVHAFFTAPTPAGLAVACGAESKAAVAAPNLIPDGCEEITPEMLSLVRLSAEEIARIVACVPGGARNVQDVYPLAPLQEGMLFHHLLSADGDPYLLQAVYCFEQRSRLDDFLEALQAVVDRHDILRSAILWEGLPDPVQVVLRRADLPVETIEPQDFDPRRYRLDVRKAPLLRAGVWRDGATGKWSLVLLLHHLVCDHATFDSIVAEIQALLADGGAQLPDPVPFREFIARTRSVAPEVHDRFFKEMLHGVEDATAPFGLTSVHSDGWGVRQVTRAVDPSVARDLRAAARAASVGVAALFHVAYARVLAAASGRDDVVFGTVLFGRSGGDERGALGLFINTLPVRLFAGEIDVAESVRAAHHALAGLMQHEHASLASAQRAAGLDPSVPLFSALINYISGSSMVENSAAAMGEGIEFVQFIERTNYPLALTVDDLGAEFNLTVQACESIDPDRVAAMMQEALEHLAFALRRDPSTPLHRIGVIPAEERLQLLRDAKGPTRPFLADRCIEELFEEHARTTPQAVALSFEDVTLTYDALNRRANRLARYLRTLGVRPDARVAVCLERSVDSIVSLLAVLKAGGAYVPLDPAYPPERLSFMLADSTPAAVLTHGAVPNAVMDVLAAHGASQIVDLDVDTHRWSAQDDVNLARGHRSSEDLAYVIYTSGSSGRPKGVMVEHRGLCNLAMEQARVLEVDAASRILQFSSFSFDASILEVVLSLCQGARLCVSRAPVLALDSLDKTIEDAGITHVLLPPAVLAALPPHAFLRSVRVLLTGGEAPTAEQARRWATGRRFVNAYGPTEATILVSLFDCDPESDVAPLLGRPISNASMYVLDSHGALAPDGVTGELYIGGCGVARGYLNQPELSSARFVSPPFAQGDRLYKTGDLVRRVAGGTLEFKGRSDDQVKVRGFRIELGEIASRLREHLDVSDAHVIVREDAPGEKRLVAYVTAGSESPDAGSLRTHLAASLPDYMVPVAYVVLDAFPLTPNGKLDRRALAPPDGRTLVRGPYEAPANGIERAIAAIWSELLDVPSVGRWDNFFEIGGHSLLMVRAIERMRRAGLTAGVPAVFAARTLAELATRVESGVLRSTPAPSGIPDGCTRIEPGMLPLIDLESSHIESIVASIPGGASNVADIYPLAPLQEGIFFHHVLDRRSDPYVVRTLLRFDTRERLDAFTAALQAVVARHDVLRTSIHWEGLPEPVQVVWRNAPSILEDAGVLAAGYRFDITRAPLLRAAITTDGGRPALALLFHHIAMDHTSLETLLDEVRAHMRGEAARLPKALPFRDFVARVRDGLPREHHEMLFRAMLSDITEPTAPFGLLDVRGDGACMLAARLEVGEALSARLRRQARARGVSAASLCHLAFARVLGAAAGRDDVVFATVLLGRMHTGDGDASALGLFMNALPVRLHLGELPVEEALSRTHQALAELLLHEHASLALAQRCSSVPPPLPLFTALLNYRHIAPASIVNASDVWAGIETIEDDERTNYPLTLSVDDYGDTFALTAQLQGGIEAERVCAMMHAALAGVVDALESTPGLPMAQIDVIPAAERRLQLIDWNDAESTYPSNRCAHELFEERARATPAAVAVVCQDREIGYGELDERAERLARHLRHAGVKCGARVALCMERSVDAIVGVLAILKAGGAYVPLDPSYPAGRLAFILEDCAPLVALSHDRVPAEITALLRDRVPTIDVAAFDSSSDMAERKTEEAGTTPEDLAYVIYTSGSTGRPKGVKVAHRNLVASTCARMQLYGRYERFLLLSSMAFDSSVAGIFGTLLSGGTLYLTAVDRALEPELLRNTLREHRITTFLCVPSLLQALLDVAPGPGERWLRQAIVAGETCPPGLVARFARSEPQAQLYNEYGPTEATVWSTAHRCVPEDAKAANVPIGRPIPNARAYVLGSRRELLPIGTTGDLFVGGAGVSAGYWNRPELDAERFAPNPFVEGDRLYKTGDLARYRPDGAIEFLGRIDGQVKLRGFRIELGEIEARLAEHDGVREAVVVAREDSLGEKRLVAYYTQAESEPPSAEALRAHLGSALPEHMIPAAYVAMPALPLTPNGKIDRSALPAPGEEAFALRGYEAPANEREESIARIWSEVLQLDKIGRNDHFFELGGHSLLAVRAIELMRREGLYVDVRALFASPTPAELAAAAATESPLAVVPANRIPAGCSRITPGMLTLVSLDDGEIERIADAVPGGASNIQDVYPLAPLQEGIVFHHRLAAEGDPYLSYNVLRFDCRERMDGFVVALQSVIDRHDILRTSIHWEGVPSPLQIVHRRASLVVERTEFDPKAEDLVEALLAKCDPRRHRVDLRNAPLLRAAVACDALGRWTMVLLFHHVVADHTTLEAILAETHAHRLGYEDRLAAPVAFRGFVAQALFGAASGEHETFFRDMLADVVEPTIPFGLAEVRGDGTLVSQSHLSVDAGVARRLRALARNLGVSVASICHVAYARVLAAVSNRDAVVFGTVVLGRMQGGEGADRVLGLCINTLPVRIDIRDRGVRDTVRRTHALLASLMRHEHAPLALAQRCSRVASPTPLFSALLNYRHGAAEEQDGPQWEGIELLGGEERSNYALTLSIDDTGDSLALTAQVCAPVDPMQVCSLVHEALASLAGDLQDDPEARVCSTNVVPGAVRRRMLEDWNATERELPLDRGIHCRFESVAGAAPSATAITHAGVSVSYAELNDRANRLAGHLRAIGLAPGDRAAIQLDRSVDLICAQLAILKCGAAYVPMGRDLPSERLSTLLEDCRPRIVLTTAGRTIPGIGASVRVNVDAVSLSAYSTHDSSADVGADAAAYIMYTSGSTGEPKGVVVPHRAIARLVLNNGFAGFGSDDRVAFAANPAFDASTLEVWAPLLNGGSVVVFDRETVLTPKRFNEELLAQGVTVLWLTAGLFAQYADALGEAFSRLRYLIAGGDVLDRDAVARVLKNSRPEHLLNGYGPTETTTFAATYEVTEVAEEAGIPIGRPIGNTRIYIVDAQGVPVPPGATGELYVGGMGVALGYWNRPELTAERFVASPFVEGDRLYKTGDLGRYRSDGAIEFLGRNDGQVKIRGFRIEVGEIEARLRRIEGVGEAVVVAREDAPGEKRLVAYYTLGRSDADLQAEALRASLLLDLPEYMVPAAYVELDALPLTPNGKVDRSALPMPGAEAFATRGYEAPVGEREAAIARIWSETLQLDRIGRNDDFFELGGHSLLIVRVIERMRSEGLHVDVHAFFTAPTPAGLAVACGAESKAAVAAPNLIPDGCEEITPEMLSLC